MPFDLDVRDVKGAPLPPARTCCEAMRRCIWHSRERAREPVPEPVNDKREEPDDDA